MEKKPKKKLGEYGGWRIPKIGEKQGKHRLAKVGDKKRPLR